jgi:hypothetical protein
MLQWLRKHWILSLFLLLGGVPAGLNYSGFCWAEKRWLNDEEMIRGAIAELLRYDTTTIEFPIVGYQVVKLIKENSVEEFLNNNPNCCFVSNGKDTVFMAAIPHTTDGIMLPPLDSKFLGQYRNSVAIYYNQSYLDLEKNLKTRQKMYFVSMANCGTAYHWPR